MFKKRRPMLPTANRVAQQFSHVIYSDGLGHGYLVDEGWREKIRYIELGGSR